MTSPKTAADLTPEAARALTEEVKADAQALWEKCLRLYEGKAHLALGYSSWGRYMWVEFGRSKSHAYRLIHAAEVNRMLPESPDGERVTEAQARELVPLLPDEVRVVKAFREAKAAAAKHGVKLTAKQVRQSVFKVNEEAAQEALAKGETDKAVELLGFELKHPTPSSGDRNWKCAPREIPLHKIPAALAAHDRIQAESDLLRAAKGKPPVQETITAKVWRRRLAESKRPAPPWAKAIAELEKARGDEHFAKDRAILAAAIALLQRAAVAPTPDAAGTSTPVNTFEPLTTPPTAPAADLPPLPGQSLLPEPVLVELEELVAA